MNEPEPTDEQLAALLRAADAAVPPPDPAFLAALRNRSLVEFQSTALQSTPSSRWKRIVTTQLFRRAVYASAAAVVLLGIVIAAFMPNPPSGGGGMLEPIFIEEKLTDDGRIGKVTDAQGVVSVKPVLHE